MRIISLLPLTALAAVAAACGSGTTEQAARSITQRDLTLVTQAAHVQVASPVEMRQPYRPARRARAPSPRRLEPKVQLAAVVTPAPTPATPEPVAQPADMAPTPANDRELLPGKTVTLIPVSNGPSAGPDETDDLPTIGGRTMVVRGGGTCRGGRRGPGIGIAAVPRPDFR